MDWGGLLEKLAIPAAVTIGTWIWAKVTGKKEQKRETRSILDDIVENIIYELLDKYPLGVEVETYLKNSRGYIAQKIWTVATKRGIPRNKVTEQLFNAALERGTKLLAHEITELRKMNEQRKHELEMRRAE